MSTTPIQASPGQDTPLQDSLLAEEPGRQEIAPEDLEQTTPFQELVRPGASLRADPESPQPDLGSLHMEKEALHGALERIRENTRLVREQEARDAKKTEPSGGFLPDIPPPKPGSAALVQAREGDDPGVGLEQFLPVQAAAGFIDAINDLGVASRDVTNWLSDRVGGFANAKLVFGGPDGGVGFAQGEEAKDIPTLLEFLTPEVAEARSTLGRTVRSVTKFVGGFWGAGKFQMVANLAKVGRKGMVAANMIRGAMADFVVFDPHEERLANMLQRVTGLRDPITEFLKAKPEDEAAVGRFKNAIEGLGIGALFDGLFAGVRVIKAKRQARALVSGIDEETLVKEMLETTKAQREHIEKFLGDPKLPLFRVEPIVTGKPGDVAEALVQAADVPLKAGRANKVFINWSRFDSPDDIKSVIQDMADALAPSIEKARRGVRTWSATKLSAEQLDAWAILATRRKGQPLGADEITAVRELWAASGAKVLELARVVKADQGSVPSKIALRKMLAIHSAIQDQVVGARTEIARAMNALKIGVGDDVAFSARLQELTDLVKSDVHIGEIAERIVFLSESGLVKEADKFVMGIWKTRISDGVRQLFYMSMLSSPHTHARNIIGNTAVIPIQMLERKFGSLFGQAFGNQNIPKGEALSMLFGGIQGFKDAFRVSAKARQVITQSMKLTKAGDMDAAKLLIADNADEFGSFYRSAVTGQSGIGIGKVELPRLGAFDPEKLGLGKKTWGGRIANFFDTMTTMPVRGLAAADEIFKSVTGGMEMRARAWRKAADEVATGKIPAAQFKDRIATLVSNPDEEMRIASRMFGELSTFTNEPLATKAWQVAQDWQQLPIIGRYTLPFRRTPYNLMTFTFRRTPIAPFMKSWQKDIAAGGARGDLAWTQMLMGSAVLISMTDLAMQGLITGQGPVNKAERDTMIRGGWEPWSVKTFRTDSRGEVLLDAQGDPKFRYFSYRSLEPISTPIGLAANAFEIIRYADWESSDTKWNELIIGATMAIAAQVTSQNYMSGISDFFDVMSDPQRYGERWWQRAAGLVVPRGLAVAKRTTGIPGIAEADPTVRMATTIMESIRKDTPGLSEDLPPMRDAWGRPINRSSGIGSVYDMISPIYSKDPSPEPIDKELNRLETYIGNPDPKMSIRGVEIDLSDEPVMYSRFLELQGHAMIRDRKGTRVGRTGKGLMGTLNDLVTGKHPRSRVYDMITDGSDGGKAADIRAIRTKFIEAAKEVLLKEFPELEAEVERRGREKKFRFKALQRVLGE